MSLSNLIVKNPVTTILAAILAALYYLQGYGPNFPTDGNGIAHLVVGLLIAALGTFAADANAQTRAGNAVPVVDTPSK